MRKRLLGAIAAVAAGAGAAWGQAPAPPPPMPIGTVGGYHGGLMPVTGAAEPIPPPVGFGPGMAADPAGMFPGGPVGYPPPGMYGQPGWQPPFTKHDGLYAGAPRVWLTGEYLLWFAKSQPVRFPFVTTSAPVAGGRIGETSTLILHPTTGDLGYNLFSGFRITGGFFKDDCRRHGWYASGFMTEHKANVFFAQSDPTGQPLLARPFINAVTGQHDVLLVSFPTFAAGNVTVYSSSRTWGAEGGPIVNLFRSCPDDGCGPFWNVDLLFGFRYFELKEDLRMQSFTDVLPGQTVPFDGKLYFGPVNIEVHDEFTTLNQFYGGQVGLNTELRYGKYYLGALGKIALGVMHQRVDINGWSVLRQDPAAQVPPAVVPGGLYANATNIGRYRNDEFAVIPEVNVNLGYNWTSWMTTFIGYSFIYASRVVRPGDQYSPVVNPALVPTSPSFGLGVPVPTPNPVLTQSDFWIQGISFGINLRY
jgi:hypothetical protein